MREVSFISKKGVWTIQNSPEWYKIRFEVFKMLKNRVLHIHTHIKSSIALFFHFLPTVPGSSNIILKLSKCHSTYKHTLITIIKDCDFFFQVVGGEFEIPPTVLLGVSTCAHHFLCWFNFALLYKEDRSWLVDIFS